MLPEAVCVMDPMCRCTLRPDTHATARVLVAMLGLKPAFSETSDVCGPCSLRWRSRSQSRHRWASTSLLREPLPVILHFFSCLLLNPCCRQWAGSGFRPL